MRALLKEEPYASRFTLEVFGFTSEKGLEAQKLYAFGPDRHGLVVLSAGGRPPQVRPGHDYGSDEIRASLEAAWGG